MRGVCVFFWGGGCVFGGGGVVQGVELIEVELYFL